MKTKLFLMLFALNGLLVGANSALATAPNSQSISSLSHTISNLVDLDPDAHSLVELAINRALLAKQVKDNQGIQIGQQEILITGNYSIDDFKGRGKKPESINPNAEPIINGRVANPNPEPIINGRVANPRSKPPIDKEPPVLINGLIYNPNQQPRR